MPSDSLAVTKSADTTTCDPALLAWNLAAPGSTTSKTCSGGVAYTTFNPSCSHTYPPGPVGDAHCPEVDIPQSHQVANSCWWASGYGNVHVHTTLPTQRVQECCDPSNGPCPKPPCRYVTEPSETCAQKMADDVSYDRTSRYQGMLWQQPNNYGASITGSNPVQSGIYCDYDLQMAPLDWQYSPNGWNCGTYTVNDPAEKTWPSCTSCNARDASGRCTSCNGCTVVVDDQSCGDINGTQYSAFGSGLPTVHDLDSANCLTDENNKIDPASPVSDVALKYKHLTDNLAHAKAGTTTLDNAALAKKIIVELKLLFEMFGDSLTPDQQSTILALYNSDPDSAGTPSCGVAFVAPDTSKCDAANAATITKVNDELELCARLTAPYVNPAVRDQETVKKICVDTLATDIAALRPTLLANGGVDDGSATTDPLDVCGFKAYRAAYDQYVTKPIEGRLEGQVDPTKSADQPEVVARLRLLDRWYTGISQSLYPFNPGEAKASSVQAAAWQHLTDAEGIFWQAIYRRLFPNGAVQPGDGGVLTTGDGGVPNTGDAGPTSATFTAAQVAALVKDTLNADRAVLKLLFPYDASTNTVGDAPMKGAMLLPLMGDAFDAFSQRMHDIGIYHDMGCAYLGCGPAVQSEIVWLMQMLADMPDAPTFSASIAAARLAKDGSGNPVVRSDPGNWLDIFTSINAQHTVLENAVKNLVGGGSDWTYAANGESLLTDGTITASPGPVRHLAGELQKARGAEQQYRTTGLFSPSPRNRLPAGMAQDTIDGIRADVSKRAADLTTAAGAFSNDLTALATSVVSELAPKAQMTHSLDEIRKQALDFDNTMADLAGLQDSLEANHSAIGVLAKSFSALTAFDDGTLINAHVQGPWTIDNAAAKATGPINPNSNLTSVAVKTVNGIAQGTVVTIQVDPNSKWTPTCAIQQKANKDGGLKSPIDPKPQVLDLSAAQTGPEGFIVTMSNGSALVQSNQAGSNTSKTTSQGIEGKSCVGARAQAGIGVPGQPTEAYVYADVSACASIGESKGDTTNTGSSDSSSVEQHSTMNFASGYRLDTTPFPSAPAGSLLAITTPAGQPNVWRDIRVVQAPSTAIIVPESSDLYLVANDIAGCAENSSYALQVSVGTMVTAGTATQWVTGALGAVSTYFDAKVNGPILDKTGKRGPSILTQGRLTPNQVSTFRDESWGALIAACKADATVTDKTLCDTSKLPETVKEFITTYIDRGIEEIDLRIAILQAKRSATGIGLQFQQLIDDYNAAQRQSQIAELVPQWMLRRLDTQLLQAQTAQLVNAATFQLYPVLQLRYPDVFAAGLENDRVLRSNMQTLVDAAWDAPVDDLARSAAAAATELSNATQSIAVTYPPVTPKAIALAFSKTGKVTHQWQSVGDGRGALVWQQAYDASGGHVATFHIQPEDLYNTSGGLPSLRCTEQVPVLRDFAVVLAGTKFQTNDENNFLNRPITLDSWSARRMQFPRAALIDPSTNAQIWPGGILNFDLGNADWAQMDTQVLVAADVSTALAKYNARQVPPSDDPKTYFSNGRGVSPFNDIAVDFSALFNTTNFPNAPMDLADHMVLILNLEFRQQSQPMTFINSCK